MVNAPPSSVRRLASTFCGSTQWCEWKRRSHWLTMKRARSHLPRSGAKRSASVSASHSDMSVSVPCSTTASPAFLDCSGGSLSGGTTSASNHEPFAAAAGAAVHAASAADHTRPAAHAHAPPASSKPPSHAIPSKQPPPARPPRPPRRAPPRARSAAPAPLLLPPPPPPTVQSARALRIFKCARAPSAAHPNEASSAQGLGRCIRLAIRGGRFGTRSAMPSTERPGDSEDFPGSDSVRIGAAA